MSHSGMEMEGYTKFVKKLYNKAFYEFEDERIPNANVRFSDKHVCTEEEAGAYGFVFATITVPAGYQLRLLYLNFWTKDPKNPGQLIITQSGGTAHGLPAGQVDAIMVPGLGRYIYKGSLESPIHILEGTVTFQVQNPVAGEEYGLSFWGDQNKPQVEH